MRQLLIAIVALFGSSVSAYALDITTCGQIVPGRQVAVLQADLDVASDVSVHHHTRSLGVSAFRATLERVTAHHNNFGIAAAKLVGTDVTASDNEGYNPGIAGGQGVYSEKGVLTRFTATGNTNPGIGGTYIELIDSQVTGNGLRPPHTDVDIQTEVKPVLVNTVCLHSEVAVTDRPLPPTYPDWGVCSED